MCEEKCIVLKEMSFAVFKFGAELGWPVLKILGRPRLHVWRT